VGGNRLDRSGKPSVKENVKDDLYGFKKEPEGVEGGMLVEYELQRKKDGRQHQRDL
jgi:hypothetical protein